MGKGSAYDKSFASKMEEFIRDKGGTTGRRAKQESSQLDDDYPKSSGPRMVAERGGDWASRYYYREQQRNTSKIRPGGMDLTRTEQVNEGGSYSGSFQRRNFGTFSESSFPSTEERSQKMENGSRSEESEQREFRQDLSIRNFKDSCSISGQGVVDDYLRSGSRISSHNYDVTIIQTFGNTTVPRKMLPVSSSPVRSQMVALHFQQGRPNDDRILEKNGSDLIRVYRRFHDMRSNERGIVVYPRYDYRTHTKSARMGQRKDQGSLGTDAESGYSRVRDRYGTGFVSDSQGEAKRSGRDVLELREKESSETAGVSVSSRETQLGSFGGATGENSPQICIQRYVDFGKEKQKYVLSLEEPPTEQMGGKQVDITLRRKPARLDLVGKQPREDKWRAAVEKFSSGNYHYGCFEHWMGSESGFAGEKRSLEQNTEPMEHKSSGTMGSMASSAVVLQRFGKETSQVPDRQQSSACTVNWWWKGNSSGGIGTSDFNGDNKDWSHYRRSGMDIHQRDGGERSGRIVKVDRQRRLGYKKASSATLNAEVGEVRDRSIRGRQQQSMSEVLVKVQLPRFDGNKRVFGILDTKSKLGRPTSESNPQSIKAYPGRRRTRYFDSSMVGSSGLVANVTKSKEGVGSVRTRIKCGTSRTIKMSGTLEKQKLGVSSSDILSTRENELIQASRATSTVKMYNDDWKMFKDFAEELEVDPLPASEDIIVKFLVWLDLTGVGWRGTRALAAIKWKHAAKSITLVFGGRTKLVAEGLSRKSKRNRKYRARDPLPAWALKKWLLLGKKRKFYLRNAAIIVLGMRTMRRASELCNLKVGDLTFVGKVMWVFVRSQKNDQQARGLKIPVDITGGLTCPVTILRNYLMKDKPTDWLFMNARGEKMSVSSISDVVKLVAKVAGCQGAYSSHSLRIGGASAAMKGGLTKEQIMTIGGWSSNAVDTYLRPLETVKLKASARMGF